MSRKSLDAKTIFWEHISNCLRAFTKYLISSTIGNRVLAQINFWSDLVQLFWHFHCFFHTTKAIVLPVQWVLYLSLVSSPTTGANYRGHENRLCPPPLPSRSAEMHQGTVKTADLISQGFAGNERNIERATLRHIQMPGGGWNRFQMLVVLYWCGRSSITVMCSEMTPCFGLRPFAWRRSPSRKALAIGVLHIIRKTMAAVFRSRLTLA